MKISLIFIVLILQSCSSNKSIMIWEINKVSKDIKDSKIEDSFALDYMLNKELKGIKILIEADSMKMQDKQGHIIDANKIIKKSNNFYEIIASNAKKKQIQYSISTDKKECIFILPDGSTLHTVKIQSQ